MKSYTDLEQSKKLAKFLPLESADMWWAERYEGRVLENGQYVVNDTPYYYLSIIQPSSNNCSQDTVKDIPCWSLSKLCELMEVEYKIEKSYLDQSGVCTYSFIFEGFPDGQPGYYRTYEREEMIDAAVEFIEFLKRNELL